MFFATFWKSGQFLTARVGNKALRLFCDYVVGGLLLSLLLIEGLFAKLVLETVVGFHPLLLPLLSALFVLGIALGLNALILFGAFFV